MSDDFEQEVVSMEDENGIETEFIIIDNVMESSLLDEEEADAIILKEIAINAEGVTYEWVEEDAEFERVSALFARREGEYTIKID